MTDRLALPRRYRDQLEALLSEHVPGVEVWAYGSRVNGESHEGSDLDLVLRGPALEPLDGGFYDLLEAIEKSNIPILVQTHDWAMLPESFHREIEQAYVIVQSGAKKAAAEWIHCTLADVCSAINYGLTASASSRSDGPKFLRITDIVSGQPNWNSVPHVEADDDTMAKYRLYDGDIVIARTGASTGTSAYVRNPPPSVFASYLVRLQARPEFDARFLAYYLKSEEFWEYIRGVLGDKSAQPNASASTMTAAPFRAPKNKAEQRAIAHVLGTLDDKIELNRRMNETLEAMARALFKSWFVDFDPVRAKLEGRWRRGASLPGLPAEHYPLFPDRLVDSALGPIPEGWDVRGLGDCIDVERGLSYKGAGLSSSGVPMHNLNSIYEGGGYKDDGIKYYNGDYQPRHLTQPGEVIIANTEQGHDRLLIGFAAIVPKLFGDYGLFSHHIYRVRPKSSLALAPDFVCQLLNTQAMHDTVSGYATGTTVNMLPVDALRLPPIAVPPRKIVATFSTLAELVRLRHEKSIAESQFLAIQRDALLPKLVSGEMGVGEAEQFIERTM